MLMRYICRFKYSRCQLMMMTMINSYFIWPSRVVSVRATCVYCTYEWLKETSVKKVHASIQGLAQPYPCTRPDILQGQFWPHAIPAIRNNYHAFSRNSNPVHCLNCWIYATNCNRIKWKWIRTMMQMASDLPGLLMYFCSRALTSSYVRNAT